MLKRNKLIQISNYINVIQANGSMIKVYDKLIHYFRISGVYYKNFINNNFKTLCTNTYGFFEYNINILPATFFTLFSYYFIKKRKKVVYVHMNSELYLKNKSLFFKETYQNKSTFLLKDNIIYNNHFIISIIGMYQRHVLNSIFFNI